jgi:hypothetical protein
VECAAVFRKWNQLFPKGIGHPRNEFDPRITNDFDLYSFLGLERPSGLNVRPTFRRFTMPALNSRRTKSVPSQPDSSDSAGGRETLANVIRNVWELKPKGVADNLQASTESGDKRRRRSKGADDDVLQLQDLIRLQGSSSDAAASASANSSLLISGPLGSATHAAASAAPPAAPISTTSIGAAAAATIVSSAQLLGEGTENPLNALPAHPFETSSEGKAPASQLEDSVARMERMDSEMLNAMSGPEIDLDAMNDISMDMDDGSTGAEVDLDSLFSDMDKESK